MIFIWGKKKVILGYCDWNVKGRLFRKRVWSNIFIVDGLEGLKLNKHMGSNSYVIRVDACQNYTYKYIVLY